MKMKTEVLEAIAELRKVVSDGERPLADRQLAAAHVAALRDRAVDMTIEDDDLELVRLTSPWQYEDEAERKVLGRYAERSKIPVAEAKAVVRGNRKTRSRYSAVRDSALPMLERLAVCQLLLDDAADDAHYRRNGFTPEKLLASITTTA